MQIVLLPALEFIVLEHFETDAAGRERTPEIMHKRYFNVSERK